MVNWKHYQAKHNSIPTFKNWKWQRLCLLFQTSKKRVEGSLIQQSNTGKQLLHIMFHSPLSPTAQRSQIPVLLWATEWAALGSLLGLEHPKPVSYSLQSGVEAKANYLHTIPHLHSAVITDSWSKILLHVLINKASNGLVTDYLRNCLSSTILSNSCCQLQQRT